MQMPNELTDVQVFAEGNVGDLAVIHLLQHLAALGFFQQLQCRPLPLQNLILNRADSPVSPLHTHSIF